LFDTNLDEEQRKYVKTLRDSCGALMSLLNDILDFSKIEAGMLTLEKVDFDLRELLHNLACMMALSAKGKGVDFICKARKDVPALVSGDPGRLRQVLFNLVGNAIKFTHVGSVSLSVSLSSQTEEEVVLHFCIKDTGIGIPADKHKMLFQKFAQLDASMTRKYGGSGLGLAISKWLVERMGGCIGVTSEEGRGSEFWFTVRLGKQHGKMSDEINSEHIYGTFYEEI